MKIIIKRILINWFTYKKDKGKYVQYITFWPHTCSIDLEDEDDDEFIHSSLVLIFKNNRELV